MKYILMTFILVISSCGSSDKNSSAGSTPEDKEFGWIENKAFNKVSEVPYNSSEDIFKEVMNDDSLSAESISRLPAPKIERISESSDPVSQGIGKCYGKDFAEAEKVFESNYKRYKNHPGYWNQIGTCQFLKGEYRKALLFYNKSRGLNPRYAPPVNNIGVIHQRQGRDQKALSAYEKAVELNKFSLTPLFNLGQLYLKYGFVEKAEGVFNTLYRKNSDDVDVLSALGTSALLKEDYSRAVSFFSKIPRRQLSEAKLGLNFSVALKAAGREKDAKTVFERVDPQSLGDLGGYYNKVGRFINE
ncbi:MAG: tetratricopeptide (TPR) repeat protein [Bacteriovoracaceae bacterium]|jgi:tetratricopeptide (TPR) repeat protein